MKPAKLHHWKRLQYDLWLWDPLNRQPPRDEYDCLVTPVLCELERRLSYVGVAAALSRALSEHFGAQADRQELMLFAASVVEWFALEQPP